VARDSEDYVAESVQDVQTAVRICAQSGSGLSPVGGGTQLHIGHEPSRPVRFLSTRLLNQVVEYNPDDLVIIAEAGLTLSSLQATLADHHQWLPVEVALPSLQTLGGIVATRANSHIRAGYGSIRDWLIGVEVVNSASEVVVGGGKVVKNVSGYDLPKLYCGSWGTLGVLTKLNFKVAPLPESDRSLLVILAADRNSEQLIDVLFANINPSSTLLFNGAAAKRNLGADAVDAQYLLVRFLGFREDVDGQVSRTRELVKPFAASVLELPDSLARNLARLLGNFPLDHAPLTARYHILSSQVGAYARMVEWISVRAGLIAEVLSDAACGIVTAHFRPLRDDVDWNALLPLFLDKAARVGGSLIVERMPEEWREAGVTTWSPVLPDHKIMRLIKEKLDPFNLFNPGRFMGGI
jgi:glycolate oxidase FAD binding subunit